MGQASGRKSIFVTGAASDIGAETARHFTRQGWFAGLYDTNEGGLQQIAGEIGADNCHLARLDVRSREDWAAAVNSFCQATDGQMHVLFNHAGVLRHDWFEDIGPHDNDWIVDVNLKGVINGIEASMDALKRTPGARIVNTASTARLVAAPQLAVHAATRFAVRGLTEALDVAFRDLDIRVTSLMPWLIDAPIPEMGVTHGDAETIADGTCESGMRICPAALAAERAWDAAHGDELHYLFGKDTRQAELFSRFLPKRLRSRLDAELPAPV